MKHITLFLFFAAWQTISAQFTAADLVYKCDFEANDPVWAPYNEPGFTSKTANGKFILQHAVKMKPGTKPIVWVLILL